MHSHPASSKLSAALTLHVLAPAAVPSDAASRFERACAGQDLACPALGLAANYDMPAVLAALSTLPATANDVVLFVADR